MADEKKIYHGMNLFQRILAIMGDAERVGKELEVRNRDGSLKYKAVSHDSVTSEIRPLLVKWGVVAIPTVAESSIEVIPVEGKSAIQNAMVAVETLFLNVDDPTDRFTVRFPGQGLDYEDKSLGKAVSYAVKYSMLKVFCLSTGDDPERDTHERGGAKPLQTHQDKKAEAQADERLVSKDGKLRGEFLAERPSCKKCGGATKFLKAGKTKSGSEYPDLWVCAKEPRGCSGGSWKVEEWKSLRDQALAMKEGGVEVDPIPF